MNESESSTHYCITLFYVYYFIRRRKQIEKKNEIIYILIYRHISVRFKNLRRQNYSILNCIKICIFLFQDYFECIIVKCALIKIKICLEKLKSEDLEEII